MSFISYLSPKNLLLIFIRRFYNPEITYIDTLIKDWNTRFIQFVVDVIINGLVLYITLVGLSIIFPVTSKYIYLGTSYWEFPIIVIYLGIIGWFFRGLYNWIKTIQKIGGVRK